MRSSFTIFSSCTSIFIPLKTPVRKRFASSAASSCSSAENGVSSRPRFSFFAVRTSSVSPPMTFSPGSSAAETVSSSPPAAPATAEVMSPAVSVTSSVSDPAAPTSTTASFLLNKPKSPLEGCSMTRITASARESPSFFNPSSTASSTVFAVILTVSIVIPPLSRNYPRPLPSFQQKPFFLFHHRPSVLHRPPVSLLPF